MITEYSNYDISLSDEELKKSLQLAIHYRPSTISVFLNHIRLAKNIISQTDTQISTPIDYPLGILDTKSRVSAIESAIKAGAHIINIVAQPSHFCNRKYDKFREDIKTNLELCNKASVELRYILEYRVFSYELLYKVSQILMDFGINTIYPSSGYLLDDINDNILAAALINKKVPINIICNGNIWNISQITNVIRSKVYLKITKVPRL
jgi:deoxyribose-phosphate aldolase